MPKIEFYRASVCPKCKRVEVILKKILEQKGLNYTDVVLEKYTDNPINVTELKNIGILGVPTLKANGNILLQNDASSEVKVRIFLEKIGIY